MSRSTLSVSDLVAIALGALLPLAVFVSLLRIDIDQAVGTSTNAQTRSRTETAAATAPTSQSGATFATSESGSTALTGESASTARSESGSTAATPESGSTVATEESGSTATTPESGTSTARPESGATATTLESSTIDATPEASATATTAEAVRDGVPTQRPETPEAVSASAFPEGWFDPPSPYFSFGRPFAEPLVIRPTRFYPYGTDAGGQYLLHHGVDISNPFGEPVLAVGAGRVVYAGDDLTELWGPTPDFYGQLVVIEHAERLDDRPLFSLYGHVETVNVRAGDVVRVGERIATVGSGGVAMGPHLHLEFRTDARDYGSTINPELFLSPLVGHGTIVVRVRDEGGGRRAGVPVALYALSDSGEERWISEVPSYPPDPVNSAWGWDEDVVFGDLPIGRYVVRSRAAFQAVAEVRVRPRGATIVRLAP